MIYLKIGSNDKRKASSNDYLNAVFRSFLILVKNFGKIII